MEHYNTKIYNILSAGNIFLTNIFIRDHFFVFSVANMPFWITFNFKNDTLLSNFLDSVHSHSNHPKDISLDRPVRSQQAVIAQSFDQQISRFVEAASSDDQNTCSSALSQRCICVTIYLNFKETL